jgi:soluble lytic murein transglycosylase
MVRYRILQILLCIFTGLAGYGRAMGDVYVFQDRHGVLNFTNVPNHSGYRRVIREGQGRIFESHPGGVDYDELIRSASRRHGLDADLIRAIIKAESDFNSLARSHKGAIGLMQLMPDTARLHNVMDVFDPSDNIEGGVRHLKLLLGRYQGDLELSLAAYNAGIQAVEKHRGIPPFIETRNYVRRVLRFYDHYRGGGRQVLR